MNTFTPFKGIQNPTLEILFQFKLIKFLQGPIFFISKKRLHAWTNILHK